MTPEQAADYARWRCPTCSRTFPAFVSQDHISQCDGKDTALPDNVAKAFEQLNDIASAAGRALGSIRTERKTAAARKSVPLATAARSAKAKPCDCGRTDGSHKWDCPAYRRAAAARHRAAKKEKEARSHPAAVRQVHSVHSAGRRPLP